GEVTPGDLGAAGDGGDRHRGEQHDQRDADHRHDHREAALVVGFHWHGRAPAVVSNDGGVRRIVALSLIVAVLPLSATGLVLGLAVRAMLTVTVSAAFSSVSGVVVIVFASPPSYFA